MDFIKSICSFISMILGLYSTLIFIRIIVSWIVLVRNRGGWSTNFSFDGDQNGEQAGSILDSVDSILGKICDPYLGCFKSVKSLRRSTVDLTPFLALVILNLVKNILSLFAQSSYLTLGVVFAIFIEGLWQSFFSFLLILLLVILIVRFFVGRSQSPNANNVINVIDPILDGPVGRVYKLFYRKGRVDDQKLVLSSIIFYAIVYFALRFGVSALVKFLYNL